MRYGNKQANRASTLCRGFTLIEVLIALVILSVGLLGVAGLQMTGMKSVQSSVYRYEATRMTQELIDRMRANISAVRDAAYSDSYSIDSLANTNPPMDCYATECSPANLAQYDLWVWGQQLKQALQVADGNDSAVAEISCSDGACAEDCVVSVVVSWQERADLQERDAEQAQAVADDDLITVKSFVLNTVF